MKAELDKLSMKFQEEIARAEEQASLKAELEWKRKLSFGRKEAIAETTNKAAAGMGTTIFPTLGLAPFRKSRNRELCEAVC